MNGPMNDNQLRILFLQPGRTSSSAMRRSIVHNPKDPSGLGVRRLGHDLVDKPSKGSHPGLGLASTKQLGSVDIPGRQISPSAPDVDIRVLLSPTIPIETEVLAWQRARA